MTITAEPRITGDIMEIALALIDRDPDQPRFVENVDTDLKGSMEAHGWLDSEPGEVRPHPVDPDRFMLVNGERRFAGAKAAGLKAGKFVLTLEVEGVGVADRLIRQIVHNQGKPLSALEEAKAFQLILDERRAGILATDANGEPVEGEYILKPNPKYGQADLARELGIPKSTINDRIRLGALPERWSKHFGKGPLQPSHGAVLAPWMAMPDKWQEKLAALVVEDQRWIRVVDDKSKLSVEELDSILYSHGWRFIKPVSEVGKAYKGPTATMHDKYRAGSAVSFAMDAGEWGPLVREKQKKRNAATGDVEKEATKDVVVPKWARAVHGMKEEAVGGYFRRTEYQAIVVVDGKWFFGDDDYGNQSYPFDPAVFLGLVRAEQLIVTRYTTSEWKGQKNVKTPHWAVRTTDGKAYKAACEAYIAKEAVAERNALEKFVNKLMPVAAPWSDVAAWLLAHAIFEDCDVGQTKGKHGAHQRRTGVAQIVHDVARGTLLNWEIDEPPKPKRLADVVLEAWRKLPAEHQAIIGGKVATLLARAVGDDGLETPADRSRAAIADLQQALRDQTKVDWAVLGDPKRGKEPAGTEKQTAAADK